MKSVTEDNVKNDADKTAIIFIASAVSLVVLLIVGLLFFAMRKPSDSFDPVSDTTITNNVVEESDKQIIDLTAKGGFDPQKTVAKANKATLLKVNTKNTFDCSSTLSIPSLGISRQLKTNGTEEIEIPAQQPGAKIAGTCSMGMYNFSLNFIQ